MSDSLRWDWTWLERLSTLLLYIVSDRENCLNMFQQKYLRPPFHCPRSGLNKSYHTNKRTYLPLAHTPKSVCQRQISLKWIPTTQTGQQTASIQTLTSQSQRVTTEACLQCVWFTKVSLRMVNFSIRSMPALHNSAKSYHVRIPTKKKLIKNHEAECISSMTAWINKH